MDALEETKQIQTKINQIKNHLAHTQGLFQAFLNTHKSLSLKERAQKYNELQKSISSLQRELNSFKGMVISNTGIRFSLDALRGSYTTFYNRWKKFESTYLGDAA